MKGIDAAPLVLVILGVVCLFGNVALWIAWGVTLLIVACLVGVILWKMDFLNKWKKYDCFGRELDLRYQVFNSGGSFLVLDRSNGAAQHFTRGRTPAPEMPGPPPQMEFRQPLMPLIENALSIYLWGEQGAGKTTLLNTLSQIRLNQGERVIAIDPHYNLNPDYPPGVEVYGAGRSWNQINDLMRDLLLEMDIRYDTGRNLYPMTIILDENTMIRKKCPYAKDFIESALSEFRKVDMKVIYAAHGKTAKIMNLEGAYDMASGIIFVNLRIDPQTGQRYAEVEKGKDKILCDVPYMGGGGMSYPGSYPGATQNTNTQHATHRPQTRPNTGPSGGCDTVDTVLCYDPAAGSYVHEPEKPVEIYESKHEKMICEMFKSGASYRDIVRQVLGKTPGGPIVNTEIKPVLRKYNLL